MLIVHVLICCLGSQADLGLADYEGWITGVSLYVV